MTGAGLLRRTVPGFAAPLAPVGGRGAADDRRSFVSSAKQLRRFAWPSTSAPVVRPSTDLARRTARAARGQGIRITSDSGMLQRAVVSAHRDTLHHSGTTVLARAYRPLPCVTGKEPR